MRTLPLTQRSSIEGFALPSDRVRFSF